jgi:hypothetical protein
LAVGSGGEGALASSESGCDGGYGGAVRAGTGGDGESPGTAAPDGVAGRRDAEHRPPHPHPLRAHARARTRKCVHAHIGTDVSRRHQDKQWRTSKRSTAPHAKQLPLAVWHTRARTHHFPQGGLAHGQLLHGIHLAVQSLDAPQNNAKTAKHDQPKKSERRGKAANECTTSQPQHRTGDPGQERSAARHTRQAPGIERQGVRGSR